MHGFSSLEELIWLSVKLLHEYKAPTRAFITGEHS